MDIGTPWRWAACSAAAVIFAAGVVLSPVARAADLVLPSAAESAGRAGASCDRLESYETLARADLDTPGRQLHVVGRRVGTVESDIGFALMEAELVLVTAQAPCPVGQVSLGTLTRPEDSAGPVELSVQALGDFDPIQANIGLERAILPNDTAVLLVHITREVEWGLTERYAVPVSISGETLAAGDRVQTGRDALSPPRFYGRFQLNEVSSGHQPFIVLVREGQGCFSPRLFLETDSEGILRAHEEPRAC